MLTAKLRQTVKKPLDTRAADSVLKVTPIFKISPKPQQAQTLQKDSH